MGFLYCFLYLLCLTLAIYGLGRLFPRRWIDAEKFPFRTYSFEKNGKLYEKIGVRKWKEKWPDASRLLHKIVKKIPSKTLGKEAEKKIPVLLKESCVAEGTHVFALIFGFACIWIWRHVGGVLFAFIYALINIPPIIIQRYNRPRLLRVYERRFNG